MRELNLVMCRRRSGHEDEMVGWPHQLDGHGFEQAPGVGTYFKERDSSLKGYTQISHMFF